MRQIILFTIITCAAAQIYSVNYVEQVISDLMKTSKQTAKQINHHNKNTQIGKINKSGQLATQENQNSFSNLQNIIYGGAGAAIQNNIKGQNTQELDFSLGSGLGIQTNLDSNSKQIVNMNNMATAIQANFGDGAEQIANIVTGKVVQINHGDRNLQHLHFDSQ